ncbi:MarR family winged helix-turn-helix transcriptional regulator [Novosphingobium sp. TH158]|uniref:MarR family winged helix-turn-helix transcriptional regulator n=1 Tax=Novosphingobium sp. TH158 TaxID=2067455 RepID=UPI000C79B881|nr:MarR family winged helix-turn-helix transcriptional regulator [Novosphingobium sp. TH158]PLK24383.1 MarR family transcriptional regulator [Novosphingobium sp. TH158]
MARPIPPLTDFLPYLLAITSNAVSGRIADDYRVRFGLRIPEWRVMAVLGDGGSMTQREMVQSTVMDKVAINRACKVLEERGLVERSPNQRDGRSHHLELTEEGRKLYSEVMPMTYHIFERIFADIEPREQEALKALLARIRDGVVAIDRGPKA